MPYTFTEMIKALVLLGRMGLTEVGPFLYEFELTTQINEGVHSHAIAIAWITSLWTK